MIRAVIFDADGMVVRREMVFSERFSKDFLVPLEKITPFFKKEFQDCLVGRADLKESLQAYLLEWGWRKSVDELLRYWFQHESNKDERMIENAGMLRQKGVKCYLTTNNEKYRTTYLFEELGLGKSFDGLFSSAYLGYVKPRSEFWDSIYSQMGKIDKRDALVWDDDQENVDSARAFGFNSELYSNYESYLEAMKQYCPFIYDS